MRKHLGLILVLLSLVTVAAVAGEAHRPSSSYATSIFYLEKGELQSATLISTDRDSARVQVISKNNQKIAADLLFDSSSSTVLFGMQQESDWPSLWIADRVSGSAQEIFAGVSMARLSPDGSHVIATRGKDNEMHLLTREGVDLARIGVHGGSAAFSPDGRYVAYMKLSDNPADLDLGNTKRFAAIAIFDVKTRQDRLILPIRNREYGVASWSPDGSRVYYLAEKETDPGNWSTAMYSMLSTGGDERIEIDPAKSAAPAFNSRTLWFPNSRIAVSEGNGIWCYLLDADYNVVKSVKLSEGDNLQVFQPGESFAFRVGGTPTWTVIKAGAIQPAIEASI